MALDKIIAYKQALMEKKRPEIVLYKDKLHPSKKSLKQVLDRNKCIFIFEIKLASPSQGAIRKDADIQRIANIYEPFADVISVLADEKFFSGSLSFVKMVSSKTTCPVLCKDVVVSPLQIYEARFYGADVVLLMLSVLDDEAYRSCAKVAFDLGLDVICEVHTEEEMERAIKLNATIIGINNRNLKTLEVDLNTTDRLLTLAPKNTFLITESGISSREHVQRFKGRVNGFLIGTSLMRSSRIDLMLRELMFGRVKICGLTNGEDARLAYESGAYYGGLNFSSFSKRKVTVDEAKLIMKDVPLIFGGVFVNQPVSEVADVARELSLQFVQLHGEENEQYMEELRGRISSDCEIWKALRIKNEIGNIYQGADRILLDTFNETVYGGTGRTFDWNLLREDKDRHRYIIAGGINPKNVEVLSSFGPFALDIASGVEEGDPRKKSLQKIKSLFSKLRP